MNNDLQNLLQLEIDLLEIEKSSIQKELQDISKMLHQKYQLLFELEDFHSVQIGLKDLIEALKEITGYEDLTIKIYALSSLFQNANEEELLSSEENMRFLGSELIIFLKGYNVTYSHLKLFDSFDEVQLDGETLLDHCSIYPKNGFLDLVVDKDIENVICSIPLDSISPDGMAKTNDSSSLLEQAVVRCIMKQQTLGYQKKKIK